MKKTLFILFSLFLIASLVHASQFLRDIRVIDQMAVGTSSDPDSSVVFDIQNTSKGSRPCPAMTAAQRNAIAAPAAGLCVFNTDTSEPNFWTGAAWVSAAFVPNPDGVANVENLGDGMSVERADLTIRVAAGNVYLDVEAVGGGDITYQIGGTNYVLDCTTGSGAGGKATVLLTEGTATVPQINYIYATEGGGSMSLNSSTSIPTGEFAWVGVANVLTDTETSTDGLLSLQRYSDSFNFTSGRGALSYERERIRVEHAHWQSGTALSVDITTNVGTPDDVAFLTAAGNVYQMHLQTWNATDSSADKIWISNDNTTPYTTTTNLNTELTDANGASLSGKFFNMVVWGAMSSAGQQKVFVNLPTGSYVNQNDLQLDVNSTAVTSIPTQFEQVGFLIAKVNLRHQTTSGGTWTLIDVVDLRGATPGSLVSGVSGNQTDFSDGLFTLFNATTTTKEMIFDLSSITAGNTRTITAPDRNLDLADPIFDSIFLSTGVTADAILDEDTMASNDPNGLSSQQAIRAFVVNNTAHSTDNHIINGWMRLSQRGDYTSSAAGTNAVYYLDRWKSTSTVVTFNKQQKTTAQPSALSGSKSLYYDVTSNGTGFVGFYQAIENYEIFAGKPYLACAWVKSNSTAAHISIYNGGGYEGNAGHTGGGAWEKLCVNDDALTVSPAQLLLILRLDDGAGGTASLSIGDYIEATGVFLILGEYNTDTIVDPIPEEDEILKARRFYQKTYSIGTAPGSSPNFVGAVWQSQSTTSYIRSHVFHPPMRSGSTPSCTAYNPNDGSSGSTQLYNNDTTVSRTIALSNPNENSVKITGTLDAADDQYAYHLACDAEL